MSKRYVWLLHILESSVNRRVCQLCQVVSCEVHGGYASFEHIGVMDQGDGSPELRVTGRLVNWDSNLRFCRFVANWAHLCVLFARRFRLALLITR
jgi:hypothetical protein